MEEMELWVDCAFIEGYKVSSFGRVMNYDKKILELTKDCRYYRVSKVIDGKLTRFQLNRLVYFSFNLKDIQVDIDNENMVVDHIDRNTSNNKLTL